MKFKLLFLALIVWGKSSYCQDVDSAKVDYESLIDIKVKEAIDKNEYVRIPIKDFEEIVENKISISVNDRINTMIGFIVAIIGILSALSIIQSNRSRNILKEQVLANITAELNAKNTETREFFENLINSRLQDIEKKFNDKIEVEFKSNIENIKSVQTQLQQSKVQIEKAEDYLINIEFEDLQKQVKAEKYTYDLTLERLTNLLQNAEDKNKDKLIPQIVNLLTYIFYDYKKYNEVTELIDKYEGKAKLISTSYINAALTAISDYHNFNSISQRDKAIDYLNKSLELTRGFGQAQALKLEIFMMDYLRSEQDSQKDEALNDVKIVLNEILKSESNAPSYETIGRLKTDTTIESYKLLVDKLYELFPDDLKMMHEKSSEYEKYLASY